MTSSYSTRLPATRLNVFINFISSSIA